MFLEYYRLIEQPFGVTPDSRFLYLGAKHREALASLLYGTECNRGFLAMIAKPGMGKTSLLYHYLSYLRGKARTAYIFRTDCDSRDFLRHVLLDLGIDASSMNLPTMQDLLNRVLTEEMRAGRRFVLVVDEAQNLEEKVLESIRLLSNYETPHTKLMQIVLAGQPQLADRLASPSMAQLRQRISMVIPIEPLTTEEVNAYIDHRLWIAGSDRRSPFTVGARKLIAEHSEGIPRNINNLCFHAMSVGCALKRSTIDRDIVLNVIADLDLDRLRTIPVNANSSSADSNSSPLRLSETGGKSLSSSNWRPRLALATAILMVLGCLLFWISRGPLRASSSHAPSAKVTAAPLASAAGSAIASPPLGPGPSASTDVNTGPIPIPRSGAQKSLSSLQIRPGQTLYQISVTNFGHYDHTVLSQLQEVNPWLTDPDYIESGRWILIPSSSANSNSDQRAAGQFENLQPAEANKP
jgi:general secretion pathway protein A